MNAVSILAFGAVFAFARRRLPKPSLIARCPGVALVAVPAMAIIVGSLPELKIGLLAGFLLIGISPV